MPTAVESLAVRISQALSLDSIDGTQAQGVFTQIDKNLDAGLAALGAATTPSALFAAERQYGADFFTLGVGVAGLGENLQQDAGIFYLIDQYLGGGSFTGATGTQADFAAFDKQMFATGGALETLGGDLARLAFVGSNTALTALETQLGKDAAALSTDFGALGGDAATLAGDLLGGSSTTTLTATAAATTATTPYQALGLALVPFVGEFGGIGYDFGQLAKLFGGGGGSGNPQPTTFAAVSSGGGGTTAAPTLDGVFAALDNAFVGPSSATFISVDSTLQSLGTPIANLLSPTVTPPTTTTLRA